MHRVKNFAVAALVAVGALAAAGQAMARGGPASGVYTLTNGVAGNAIAVYDRAPNGTLTPAGSVLTGGNGTGATLGSQGALALDGKNLVAVNAGSNTVTLLKIDRHGPGLRDLEPSGGVTPISATIHGKLVYVLNAGNASTAANITGFTIWHQRLVPLAGSSRPLSTAAPGPAQIQFSPDGRTLAVTEKTTNKIDTYAVGFGGYASGPVVSSSAGATPFGFDFDNRGRLVVSEAVASQLTSYNVAGNGAATAINSVPDGQGAACWVAVSDNGRWAYTANASTGSISSYTIAQNGSLTLAAGVAATIPGPLDLAFADGSKYLYALSNGAHRIDAFRVNGNGSLTFLGSTPPLPAGAVSVAAD
jgi:6-phosphogluconolactonase (cycloisomerase 2 family)